MSCSNPEDSYELLTEDIIVQVCCSTLYMCMSVCTVIGGDF